ncbi:Zinc finger protein 431 [Stylophora pistillata]|uniref:Zinc finger protein 431 n=2 Tax=Stylophora pistillata TaxID=50429 RepID=A0A2B4RTM8_STYPI|nr:Zinc finger protein 431 [Stylophora pistillata]
MDNYPSKTVREEEYDLKYGFTANLLVETLMTNVNRAVSNNGMKIPKLSSISHDRRIRQGRGTHVDRNGSNSRVSSVSYPRFATELQKKPHNKEQDGAPKDEDSPLQIQITSTFSLNPSISSDSTHSKSSDDPQTTCLNSHSPESPPRFSQYSTCPSLDQQHETTETDADARSYSSIPLERYRNGHDTRQDEREGKRDDRGKHRERCFFIWDYPKGQFLVKGRNESEMLPPGTNNQSDSSWCNSLPITVAGVTETQVWEESVAVDLKTNETQLPPRFASGEHVSEVVKDIHENDDITWLIDTQTPPEVFPGEPLLLLRHQTLSEKSLHSLDTMKREELQQDVALSGCPRILTCENSSDFKVNCGGRQGLKRNPRNSRRSKRKYEKARFYLTPAPEPFQNLEMQLALENDKEPVVKIPNYFFDVTPDNRANQNPQDLNVQAVQQSCLPCQKPPRKPAKPVLSEVKNNKEHRKMTTLENTSPCEIFNRGTKTLDVYKHLIIGQGALNLNENTSSVRGFQLCSSRNERPKSAFMSQSSLTSVSCPPPTLINICSGLTSRNEYLPLKKADKTVEGASISHRAENSLKSMVDVSSLFERSSEFFEFHDTIAKSVRKATFERNNRTESTEYGFPSSSSQNHQTTNIPKRSSSQKTNISPQLWSSKANNPRGGKECLSRSETRASKGISHHDVDSTYTQTSAVGNPTKEVPIAERKYQCDVCGRAFSRSNTLITHKRIHTGDRPFPCDLCGRAFRQLGNLTRHKLTHASIKPHACPQCNKCFSRTSNLNTHMRIHTNYKPFSCDFCGKGFHQKVDMKIHRYTHTGEKPHRCSKCGRGFKQLTHLKYHMRTHSAVRMYKCEHCGKGFNQKGNLQAHIYGHTGNRPYKCDICGKGFTLTSTLNTHKRTHAPDKPFKC